MCSSDLGGMTLHGDHRDLHSFPTRRSSDLVVVESGKAEGSPTIRVMNAWLDGVTPKQYAGFEAGHTWKGSSKIGYGIIKRLQGHYGISQDGRLDAPSRTIQALQNEINQYV